MLRLLHKIRSTKAGSLLERYLKEHQRLWRVLRNVRPSTLYDVFGRGQTGKRALFCYSPAAFLEPEDSIRTLRHSSLWECREIAKILDEMGYVVDVADWAGPTPKIRHRYDLLIDIGVHSEKLAGELPPACKIIAYGFRHWLTHNEAEYRRLRELMECRGVALAPRRILPHVRNLERADALLYIGNEVALESYHYTKPSAFSVASSCPEFLQDAHERDWAEVRRRFLWMGNSGMVLKGLDLVLEIFASAPEFELHIVGPVETEEDFFQAFARELRETPNIHFHGFLNVASEEFNRIVRSCVGLVYPSGSDGTPGSVMTAMIKGLIPIISRECCMDIGNAGVVLKDCSKATIFAEVRRLASTDAAELSATSKRAREYILQHHSRADFSRSWRNALAKIVADTTKAHSAT